jgi:hypothetical protein
MLAALVSLRVFEINTKFIKSLPEGAFFPVLENLPGGPSLIKTPSHLEHYAVFDGEEYYCWKRHRRELIVCDQAECPWRPEND